MEDKPHTATLPEEPASPPMPQQEAGYVSAGAARKDPSRIWLPELVQRFAGCLAPNEVACGLRLVNKATAAQFRRPQDRTIRLSLPVPPCEFARRWGGEDAMRSLNRSQRAELPCLVARSGCIANLEVLLARENAAAVLAWERAGVLTAAAFTGQLEVCRWLRQRGLQHDELELNVAARSGQREVCEWLLAQGCLGGHCAAGFAARGGHVGLMDWLLKAGPYAYAGHLLAGAAKGCDLSTLQRLHTTFVVDKDAVWDLDEAVACAAASPTADWRAKVEWLEGQGNTLKAEVCEAAAHLADGRTRLEWLLQRGYRLTLSALDAAASNRDVGVLQRVLAQVPAVDEQGARIAVDSAASAGNVAALQVLLHAPGFGVPAFRDAASNAAAGGHLPVVEFLVETLGAADVLTARVFRSAASSGSTELLAWLHAHGCPWGADVFAASAQEGSEEHLEWLVALGCPMGEDGEPYTRAVHHGGDMAMLRCLRRLGCPWSPHGRTFTKAVECCAVGSVIPLAARLMLLWLLEQGCPVDWDAALGKAQRWPGLPEWLQAQQGRRELRASAAKGV